MTTISAILITRNEAERIEDCLRALEFCDERIVVDSFSEDDTVERSRPYAEKIYRRQFISWGEQKNWAMTQAQGDWVLLVDADELVSAGLAAEIRSRVEAAEHDAYWIHRRNHFFGRAIRGAGWNRDRVLRLLRMGSGAYDERLVHEEIRLEGGRRVGELEERLDHFSYEDWPSTFERMLSYSGRGAAEARGKGTRAPGWKLALASQARFFKQYVVQGGFRDGTHGFVLCGLAASQVFLRLAKLRLGEIPPPAVAGREPRIELVQGEYFAAGVPRGEGNR
jgi:glycosyltransferase involved in cell wall biosynthesis